MTGSRHLLEIDSLRLLVDCGLFQGGRRLKSLNWSQFPVPPESLDAVLITHAHIDHTGYLPKLVREGFRGPILATQATCALLEILLPDAAHIQEQDAEYANRRGYSRHNPAQPLYTAADAQRSLHLLKPIRFGTARQLGPVSVSWLPAGHILGSAILEIEWKGHKIAFSGDLGRYDSLIMKPPASVSGAETLLMESTYGSRRHREEGVDQGLKTAVEYVSSRGGMLLIPAFAVGRTQHVLFHLRGLEEQGAIPRLPIFIDSPMAVDVSGTYCRFGDDHNLDVNLLMDERMCPLQCHATHFIRSVADSKALNRADGPGVVISASGMCTAGRILHHLKWRLPHEKNAVLFVGFQASGTRGRQLLDGAKSVRIHGNTVHVRAGVFRLDALSAHGDREDLLRWLSMADPAPEQVILVHGEPGSTRSLAERIRVHHSARVVIPEMMETMDLTAVPTRG